jgi:hypothetical protein
MPLHFPPEDWKISICTNVFVCLEYQLLDRPENQVTLRNNCYVIETAIVNFTGNHMLFQYTSCGILLLWMASESEFYISLLLTKCVPRVTCRVSLFKQEVNCGSVSTFPRIFCYVIFSNIYRMGKRAFHSKKYRNSLPRHIWSIFILHLCRIFNMLITVIYCYEEK